MPESAPSSHESTVLFSQNAPDFLGQGYSVPLLNGESRPYVNLDMAATTPALRCVAEKVQEAMDWYASVHRGTGYKSLLTTEKMEQSRETILNFVGADPDYHVALFCCNTTDAINRICCRSPFGEDEWVLTTRLEHNANLLPWRYSGNVELVEARTPCGMVDLDDLAAKLDRHKGKVRLVAITGASNLTGLIPPLRKIARMAHEAGAMLLVDGAQVMAHRPIKMGRADDPERIDFLAFSGHKMYAPFGAGVLLGPRDFFAERLPARLGGGAVELVSDKRVAWSGLPDKEEAGTPNFPGVYALATAMEALREFGMDKVVDHDKKLLAHALNTLKDIPGLRLYGGCDRVNEQERVAVVPFTCEGILHGLVAAVLGYEWGIGVRHGCFCAHLYVGKMLGISDVETEGYLDTVHQGGKPSDLPGFVRVSMGLPNTVEDIDFLATALEKVARKEWSGRYVVKEDGEYAPENWHL